MPSESKMCVFVLRYIITWKIQTDAIKFISGHALTNWCSRKVQCNIVSSRFWHEIYTYPCRCRCLSQPNLLSHSLTNAIIAVLPSWYEQHIIGLSVSIKSVRLWLVIEWKSCIKKCVLSNTNCSRKDILFDIIFPGTQLFYGLYVTISHLYPNATFLSQAL